MAIPHNSKCRYGERGAAAAKPKAQIILDAAKVSAASGGCSEPKQGQRSQSARGFCPEARCGYRNPTLSSILATQMPCRSRPTLYSVPYPQTAALPMFPTSQKSLPKQPRWTPPCSKSNSKSKKPCASTRTRLFPQNKNKLSYRRTACWYSSRRADHTDRTYIYLPTPQNLSTKSARAVEKFNRPGAVVLLF